MYVRLQYNVQCFSSTFMFQVFGRNTCPDGYQCREGQCEPDFGKNTINALINLLAPSNFYQYFFYNYQ